MYQNLNKVINFYKKSLQSVYYAKVHCPVCKEEVFANALICPFCKTDFTQAPYSIVKNWQKTATKVLLVFSGIIIISICLSGTPIFLGILVGFVLYGGGYIVIQKIQSFKNYYHKK
jgi:ribosomal protein L37AE/L43A